MDEHDPRVARANASRRLDVELAFGIEHRAANDAREPRDPADPNGDHHLLEARAEDGDDHEGEQDPWERELHVDDAHENTIRPSTEVARDEPDQASDDERDRDGNETDRHRYAPSVDQPKQDVTTEVVRSQGMTRLARWQERVAQALLVRVDRDRERDKVRNGRQQPEQTERGHRQAIPLQAPPGSPVRTGGRPAPPPGPRVGGQPPP